MEIKINKEIRNYTEKIYFGLSIRQFFFSVLACLIAIILYSILKDKFNIETLSWICILGATPFAVLGFITYNGMNAEQVLWVLIKYYLLVPKYLTFKPTNYYYELLKNKESENKNENNKKHRKK